MKHNVLLNWVLSGLFLALCFVLPFVTGQIPQVGNLLSPMHIPVFLCAFICGTPYAMLVGFIAPLLRGLTLGFPPFPMTAVPMAFELCAYGLFAGLFYKMLPKKAWSIYVALILAMILGCVVGGVAKAVVMMISGSAYSLEAFFTAYFINAWPGIVLHLVLVPAIILALRKAKIIN